MNSRAKERTYPFTTLLNYCPDTVNVRSPLLLFGRNLVSKKKRPLPCTTKTERDTHYPLRVGRDTLSPFKVVILSLKTK